VYCARFALPVIVSSPCLSLPAQQGIRFTGASSLNTHRHPELYEQDLLQFHVTLDAATERNFAYLNVAGIFNQNMTGNAIVFDGSLDHFALNASPADRTILYMEFERSKLMVE
jgi:beta-hydroxylase